MGWVLELDPAPAGGDLIGRDALLGEILAIKGAPPSTARPTLRVRGVTDSSASEERIGFIFGTGLVANFFDVYYAEGAGGYAGAARIVAVPG